MFCYKKKQIVNWSSFKYEEMKRSHTESRSNQELIHILLNYELELLASDAKNPVALIQVEGFMQ